MRSAVFPYVNGGLLQQNFLGKYHSLFRHLIENAPKLLHPRLIGFGMPAIFGSMFQSLWMGAS
jgi:hypothetical protein